MRSPPGWKSGERLPGTIRYSNTLNRQEDEWVCAAAKRRGTTAQRLLQENAKAFAASLAAADDDFGIEMQPTIDGPALTMAASITGEEALQIVATDRPANPQRRAWAISVKEAAFLAGRHEFTIIRWAREHGIGRQLCRHGVWEIDPMGLHILMKKDGPALVAYKAGDWTAPDLTPYLRQRT
jgi:hypothetical protein